MHPLIARRLEIVKTKMDGSSLFYSASQALFGNEMYMRILRVVTLYTLVKHREMYENHIANSMKNVNLHNEEFSRQFLLTARGVMKMHEYPNDIIIDSLAIALGRRVYVYSSCVDPETKQIKRAEINDLTILQLVHNNGIGEPGYFYYYGYQVDENSQPLCLYYEEPHFQPMLPTINYPDLLQPKEYGMQQGKDAIITEPPYDTAKWARKDITITSGRESAIQQNTTSKFQHSTHQAYIRVQPRTVEVPRQQQEHLLTSTITSSAAAISALESDELWPAWADKTYQAVLDSVSFTKHSLTSTNILQIINRLILLSDVQPLSNTWEEMKDFCTRQEPEKCEQFLNIAKSLPRAIYRPGFDKEECANGSAANRRKTMAKTTLHRLILEELVPIQTPGDGNW